MTEQDLINAVTLAIPADRANATAIATSLVSLAVSRIGRMRGVDFNREWVSFSLTAGDSSYTLGVDVLSKYPDIWGCSDLWFSDSPSSRIKVLPLDEYNGYARGSTTTGRPVIGTIHSSSGVLEVYPAPDSAYTVGTYAKRRVEKLQDIPTTYYDVVYKVAINLLAASQNPTVALGMSNDGLKDILGDALPTWDGTIVEVDRILDTTQGRGGRSSTSNLLGV